VRKTSSRFPRAAARTAAPLLALLLAACATLSVPQEAELGRQFDLAARREFAFLRDRVVDDYVAQMGQELVRAAGPQPFRYQFHVIEDDSINAFAGPGGHIYVHTETLLKARNASELAGVIAHEIGHVARRHIANNYNRQRNTRLGRDMLVVAAGALAGSAGAGVANLGGSLAAMAYLNHFGREAEEEADAFAVDVLPRAGYDPSGLVSFFETLRRETGSDPPRFLSDHPATEERIAATRAAIAAHPLDAALRVNDGGKLEIIQARILLLTQRRR
jgi:predicted Zn-dependent protease